MSTDAAPSTVEKTIRRVWKSAQMYIAFHKDQNKRQRSEPKFWPRRTGVHPFMATRTSKRQ